MNRTNTKTAILCAILTFICYTDRAVAQWQTSGNHIYYDSGNVGIGTGSPEVSLDVYGNGRFSGGLFIDRISPNRASAQLFFFDRSSNDTEERNWKIATLPASSNATGDKILIEMFGGNHPSAGTFQQVIHAGNRGGFKGFVRAAYGAPHSSVRIRAFEQNDGRVDLYLSILSPGWKGASVRVYEGSAIIATRPNIYQNPQNVGSSPPGVLVFDSFVEQPSLLVKNNHEAIFSGKIGVGTQHPSAELAVNGTTKTKEIIVTEQGSDWPDYVFEPGYELPGLDELDNFVKAYRHLPGLPAKEQVEQEGQNLGEIQAKLLEKIEELTLYVIELEKRDKEKEKRILRLEEENRSRQKERP